MKKFFILALILSFIWAPIGHCAIPLRADTATVIVVGPFLDMTDGITAETAIVVSGTSCVAFKYNDTTQVAINLALTATGGTYDMVHIANGYYNFEVPTALVDTEGFLILSFTSSAVFLPQAHDYVVIDEIVYDSLYKTGTDYLQVDVVQVEATDATDYLEQKMITAADSCQVVAFSAAANQYLITAADSCRVVAMNADVVTNAAVANDVQVDVVTIETADATDQLLTNQQLITACSSTHVVSIAGNAITSASIADGGITDADMADSVKVDVNTILTGAPSTFIYTWSSAATQGTILTDTNAILVDTDTTIPGLITAASPTAHAATANAEVGNTTLDGGTYADTATDDDSTYYQVGPGVAVGGFGLNAVLTFGIGTGRIAESITVNGNFDSGASRTVQVWAYNYTTTAWAQLSNSATDYGNSGSESTQQYAMTQDMRQISDGEVQIRLTSTSETAADVFNCDFVSVASVSQAASGLTADAIQMAVWARANSGHDNETIGHTVAAVHAVDALVSSGTSGTQFIIDTGTATNDAYNGMIIELDDITDNHRETRRIVDYIGASKEVFVDRAFAFTPAAGDHAHIIGVSYADVNTTHVSGTAQTANDNGADINDILVDTAAIDTSTELRTLLTGADTAVSTVTTQNLITAADSCRVVAIDAGVVTDAAVADAVKVDVNTILTTAPTTFIYSYSSLATNLIFSTDTMAEMAQGAPPGSPTMAQVLNYLYRVWRNKVTTTASSQGIYDDAGSAVLFRLTISDDGTTFSKTEVITGP